MDIRFRARFLRLAGPKNVRRFGDLCETYTQCVAKEAELRERGQVLGVDDFIPLRRQNSAVLLCFSLVEYILGIDLDDEIYEDEAFMDAYWAACDYVCWANVCNPCRCPLQQLLIDIFLFQDVYSYDMEQSKGLTGNNIVTVLMKEKKLSLQEASDFIGDHCDSLLNKYLAARTRLSPTLGTDATQFINSIGQWMIGNLV